MRSVSYGLLFGYRRRAMLIGCAVVLLAPSVVAADPGVTVTRARAFGAERFPVRPELRLDAVPDLCKSVLHDANVAFEGKDPDSDPARAETSQPENLESMPAFDQPEGSSTVSRQDLDLDGTGTKQVVIYQDLIHSWRGNWHYGLVFPDAKAFDTVKDEVRKTWGEIAGEQYPTPDVPVLGSRLWYPTALSASGKSIETGDVWADVKLFPWKDRYYFFVGTSEFDRHRPLPWIVYRLRADGRVQPACEIATNTDAQYKRFLQDPAIGAFLRALRTIGEGGRDSCGTLHSGTSHNARAGAAEWRAATRPWAAAAPMDAIAAPAYYVYDERAKSFLNRWALTELWTYREHQVFLELVGPARAALAAYLRTHFGVSTDRGETAADEVMNGLIGARLLLPSEYSGPSSDDLYFPISALRMAILKRDRAAFDTALAEAGHPSESTQQNSGRAPKADQSDEVAEAVEWPYALAKLLSAGADPNRSNAFGKTPLMAAAHFNRPDSVGLLLAAGAKVNEITHPDPQPCNEGPQISGRSALMYAAENASPILMKMLVAAGATIDLTDSSARGLDSYLAMNPRLTTAQRNGGFPALIAAAANAPTASFNCDKAVTAAERLICSSDLLKMLDAETTSAFFAARTLVGNALLPEQRAWLRRRDASCASDADPVDCLAEVLRTRERYLHGLATPVLPLE